MFVQAIQSTGQIIVLGETETFHFIFINLKQYYSTQFLNQTARDCGICWEE